MASSAGYGEWNSWSSNPERMMRLKFGETDIALRHMGGLYRADVAGTAVALKVISIDTPHARVAPGGASDETVTFLIEGDAIHLARAGRSHRFQDTTHAPPATRAAGPSDGRLVAPMNGRVVAVNVKPGDAAEPGRALVVLEAMKMEHALSIPATARVKAVHVAAGAQVSPGQLLIELEPA